MGDMERVLGIQWLHYLEEVTLRLKDMEIRFEVDGRTHVLKAIRNGDVRTISFRQMEKLSRHDDIEWVAIYTLMPTQEEKHKTKYIQKLRIKYEKVFNDIPPDRPPDRGIKNIIELEEGTKRVMITPYRHPK